MKDFRLYVITPEPVKNLNYEESVKQAILGGADIIQFRIKNLTKRELLNRGKNIIKITQKYKVPLIINDHLDLALALGAQGVHLGQDDLPLRETKKIIKDLKIKKFIIGISTHSLTQALQAEEGKADYIGVGPIFKSKTKFSQPLGLKLLQQVKKRIKIPFVAIGGINQENIKKLIKHDFRRVAVCQAVFDSQNVFQATKELKRLLDI